ncbi:hypothetical protein BDV96DRAFT_682203 [Lophiotrema nucula]|uniref:Uncharacterized protein n=1 Tax=Lophiotrema nucula TaxID=690887 RepID=A0A6A5ZVE8_9PLEO|nr:hypothetical protein BDV96DRAFT_682203 [Lophiotrema nucula]
MSTVELDNGEVLVRHGTGQLAISIYQLPRVEDNANEKHQRIHAVRIPHSGGFREIGLSRILSARTLYKAEEATKFNLSDGDRADASNYLFVMAGCKMYTFAGIGQKIFVWSSKVERWIWGKKRSRIVEYLKYRIAFKFRETDSDFLQDTTVHIVSRRRGGGSGSLPKPILSEQERMRSLMSVGPGGLIEQKITKDEAPGSWELESFRTLKFHIVDSEQFESQTGLALNCEDNPTGFHWSSWIRSSHINLHPEFLDTRLLSLAKLYQDASPPPSRIGYEVQGSGPSKAGRLRGKRRDCASRSSSASVEASFNTPAQIKEVPWWYKVFHKFRADSRKTVGILPAPHQEDA